MRDNKKIRDEEFSKLCVKYSAGYAFSNEQLAELIAKFGIANEKLVNLGGGLLLPKKNVKLFLEEYNEISDKFVKNELADKGKKNIILYELANHECQITMDYSDVVEVCSAYGITEQEVANEWDDYYRKCLENDNF